MKRHNLPQLDIGGSQLFKNRPELFRRHSSGDLMPAKYGRDLFKPFTIVYFGLFGLRGALLLLRLNGLRSRVGPSVQTAVRRGALLVLCAQ